MLFTSEIPIAGIKAGIEGDFPFLIETYIGKKGYTWNAEKLNTYGIIDNGYFEQVALGLKSANKLPKYRGGAWRVIPEIGDTWKLISQNIANRTIFISHASTEELAIVEYAMFAAEARKRGFHVMYGVTYDCEWFSKNRFIRAFQRYRFVKKLTMLESTRDIAIHLMGCNSMFELWLCKHIWMVRSADSSLPITAALKGKRVSWFGKYPQFAGFIDTPMTEKQIQLAKYNLAKCQRIARLNCVPTKP